MKDFELEVSVYDPQEIAEHEASGRRVLLGVSYHPDHWRPVEFGSGYAYDWAYYECQLAALSAEAKSFALECG